MDLTNLNDLKSLLGKYNIRLTKKLGQHFLIDKKVLEKIVRSAELKAGDKVIEIGPGVGTLTQELAKKVKRVIAIEKDKKLIKPLQNVLKNFSNVEIINQDFLHYQLSTVNCKLIADIPYYITGEIFRKIFSESNKPSDIILLLQREVGERLSARPGKMSILAISVQLYADVEIIDKVSAKSFFPAPEVESVIVKLNVLKSNRIDVEEKSFFRLVRIGFSARRKTLLNNLSAGFKIPKEKAAEWLKPAGIGEQARAQELTIEEWGEVYKAVKFPISNS